MKKYFLIILVFAGIAGAQISIEQVSTDTVDILSKKEDITFLDKSALWVSLAVPGAGHQMIKRNKSALGYITIDIFSLVGAFFFYQLSDKYEKNSRSLASVHAASNAGISDDFFWQVIGSFDNQDAYHETMRLNRDFDDRFMAQRYYWYWEDDTYREDFLKMQKTSKKLATTSAFFIGAMILNRIVAFIDIRTSVKNKYSKTTGSLSVTPYINNCNTPGIMVSSTF